MGILPREFYLMEDEDYFLLRKGFYRKREIDQLPLRRASWLICAHLVGGKNLSPIKSFWPLGIDKEFSDEAENYTKKKAEETLKFHRENKVVYRMIDGIIKPIILN